MYATRGEVDPIQQKTAELQLTVTSRTRPQIKNAIVSFSTTGIPNHWLRGQRPTYTRVATSIASADGTRNSSMTETFDERSAQSFLLRRQQIEYVAEYEQSTVGML